MAHTRRLAVGRSIGSIALGLGVLTPVFAAAEQPPSPGVSPSSTATSTERAEADAAAARGQHAAAALAYERLFAATGDRQFVRLAVQAWLRVQTDAARVLAQSWIARYPDAAPAASNPTVPAPVSPPIASPKLTPPPPPPPAAPPQTWIVPQRLRVLGEHQVVRDPEGALTYLEQSAERGPREVLRNRAVGTAGAVLTGLGGLAGIALAGAFPTTLDRCSSENQYTPAEKSACEADKEQTQIGLGVVASIAGAMALVGVPLMTWGLREHWAYANGEPVPESQVEWTEEEWDRYRELRHDLQNAAQIELLVGPQQIGLRAEF